MTPRTSISRLADDAPVPHPDSWPARKPPSATYDRAVAALQAQAGRTASAIIKARARAYAVRPRELDAIYRSLSSRSPRILVIVLDRIIRIAGMHRWFVLGGEVPAINLRAAMLYARYSRAIASRNKRKAAADSIEAPIEWNRNSR